MGHHLHLFSLITTISPKTAHSSETPIQQLLLRLPSFFQRTKCPVLFLCKGCISSPIIYPIGSQACRKSKISSFFLLFSRSALLTGGFFSWLWLHFKRTEKPGESGM